MMINDNKKGQVIFYSFMIAICVIIMALSFAPVLKQSTEDARGNTTTGMNCNNASISLYDRTACIVSDVSLFSFIVILVMIAGAVIGARVVLSK